jgi:hypothetical protein
MPDVPAFTQSRLHFEHPPEERALEGLLADRIVRSPELLESDEVLDVVPPPRSVWLLLPTFLLVGCLASLAPGVAALVGWPLMDGREWLSMVALLWLVAMPCALLMAAFALSLLPRQQALVRVDLAQHRVVLPAKGEEYSEGEVVELVELARWGPLDEKRRQFLQWSALVRDESDHFTLLPLLTIVDPTADDVRLLRRLCEALACPVTRIQLERDLELRR